MTCTQSWGYCTCSMYIVATDAYWSIFPHVSSINSSFTLHVLFCLITLLFLLERYLCLHAVAALCCSKLLWLSQIWWRDTNFLSVASHSVRAKRVTQYTILFDSSNLFVLVICLIVSSCPEPNTFGGGCEIPCEIDEDCLGFSEKCCLDDCGGYWMEVH